MSSAEEQEYIWGKLVPELRIRMENWATEYRQPRELGVAGEFVGLHRKVGKLKTIVWDGVDASGWREDPETILFEVIAHGLLMLHDLHHVRPRMAEVQAGEGLLEKLAREFQPDPPKPRTSRTHEFRGQHHHNHPGHSCEEWREMLKDDNE